MLVFVLSSGFTHSHTNTHTHTGSVLCLSGRKQASAIDQKLDLLEQIDWCPYIGSSIGKTLETGGGSRERDGGLFVIVECDVRNDRRHVGCTDTHRNACVFGGESLGAVTVKGDSCAGNSLPYEEWEQIA